MPRRENPLDPTDNPVTAFAVRLRRLRAEAGTPSYRAMAARSYYGYTTLAEAASGRRLPSWEITRAYVRACGGDLAVWERLWRETAEAIGPSRDSRHGKGGERSPPQPSAEPNHASADAAVDPARAGTLPELMGMLDGLRARAGLSLRMLVERSRDEPGHGTAPVLARTTVADFLQGSRPPGLQDVLRIVELCGGTPSDLRAWETACDRLLPVEQAPPAEGGPADGDQAGGPIDYSWRGGPTVLRILLGAQLRRLREERGISTERAGYEIRGSHSKISRMELGRVGFKERDVSDLLTLYGVSDPAERASLLELVKKANAPAWWHRYGDVLPSWFEVYLGLEEAASLLRTYEVQFVPGLLQTEEYAEAVVRLGYSDASDEEVERRVWLRTTRQRRFASPGAPTLWAVLDEAVVRRPVGGYDVMRRQVEHLIAMSELPNVTLQIVPFGAGGHAAAGGPFTILRFAEPDLSDIVYLEQLTSALYLDKPTDVDTYVRVMNELGIKALHPRTTRRLLLELLDGV
jgi:transcriptional regulator with XRE-family HTH domain